MFRLTCLSLFVILCLITTGCDEINDFLTATPEPEPDYSQILGEWGVTSYFGFDPIYSTELIWQDHQNYHFTFQARADGSPVTDQNLIRAYIETLWGNGTEAVNSLSVMFYTFHDNGRVEILVALWIEPPINDTHVTLSATIQLDGDYSLMGNKYEIALDNYEETYTGEWSISNHTLTLTRDGKEGTIILKAP